MSFTPVTTPHDPEWVNNPHGVPDNRWCALCGRDADRPNPLHQPPKDNPFSKAVARAFEARP